MIFNKPPVAVISTDRTATSFAPAMIFFDASSSYDPDGEVVKYEWFFGDGTTAEGVRVAHTFQTEGEYQVVLQISDDKGAVATATTNVFIGLLPETTTKECLVQLPPGAVISPDQLRVVSSAGTTPVAKDGGCSGVFLTATNQLVLVTDQAGRILLLKHVLADLVSAAPVSGEETQLTIDCETTALSLVILSPIFIGIPWEVRAEAQQRAKNHPSFPQLVHLIESSFTSWRSWTENSEVYRLAARISEEISESLTPAGQAEDFRWYWPRRPDGRPFDGPYVAAKTSTSSDIYLVNPKSIFYGVEDRDYDTNEIFHNVRLVSPARWFFLFYLEPGLEFYPLGEHRVIFSISKFNLYGLTANATLGLLYFLDLILGVKIKDEVIKTAIKDFLEFTTSFINLVTKPDLFSVIDFFITFLSNKTLLSRFLAIMVKHALLGSRTIDAAAALIKAFPIAKAISATISAPEKIRFIYDLITAPDPCEYAIQKGNRLTCIPKILSIDGPTEIWEDEEITFSCVAKDEDGAIVSFVWDFPGSKKTTSMPNVKYKFDKAGDYTVYLTVYDNDGAWAKTAFSVKVKERPNTPPVARLRANPTAGPAPLTVNFDASESYDPDGHIVTYRWDFGDGNAKETPTATVQHVYTYPRSFIATVTVVDDRGATASAQARIDVSPPGCPDLTITSLWTEPAKFSAGQRVTVWFGIKNIGTADSGSFRISLTLDGREIDSGYLRGLKVGEEKQAYSDVLVWPDANCHSIGVAVDPENAVTECDETNNQILQAFCPTQTCVNNPNVWTEKNEYCIGEEVKIYISITAPSYVDAWLVYPDGRVKYLLENRYLDRNAVITGKAGEPPGVRTVYVKAKACGVEKTVSWQFNISSCQPPPTNLPNLVITELQAWGNTSECPVGKVRFSFLVVNKGTAPSPKTTVFVHQEECRVFWGSTVWSADVPELRPGDWMPFNGEVVYCNSIGGDAVTLVAHVDPNNEVQETNEQDNVGQVKVNHPCAGELLPDLKILDVSAVAKLCINIPYPRPLGIATKIVVANVGTSASLATLLLLKAGLQEGCEELLVEVPSLAPQEMKQLECTCVTYASCMDANGIVTIFLMVDPQNNVMEQDENNNTFYEPVYVEVGPCP